MQNKTEEPSHLIFHREAIKQNKTNEQTKKPIHYRKDSIFNRWYSENWMPTCRRMKILISITFHKNNHKWIKYTTKSTETARRKHSQDPTWYMCRKELSYEGSSCPGIKANNKWQMGLHKAKKLLCSYGKNSTKWRRNPQSGENLCQLYIWQRGNMQNTERAQKAETRKQMTQLKSGPGNEAA